jgi:hypothetical protein
MNVNHEWGFSEAEFLEAMRLQPNVLAACKGTAPMQAIVLTMDRSEDGQEAFLLSVMDPSGHIGKTEAEFAIPLTRDHLRALEIMFGGAAAIVDGQGITEGGLN